MLKSHPTGIILSKQKANAETNMICDLKWYATNATTVSGNTSVMAVAQSTRLLYSSTVGKNREHTLMQTSTRRKYPAIPKAIPANCDNNDGATGFGAS